MGAAMLLVEMSAEMQNFGSAERLASWVGICPGNNESAGKRKSGKTRKGNAWVRRLRCGFAQAASRSRCALKSKFAALSIRKGHKKSIVALGHKMLRIIFAVLKTRQPYRDRVVDYEALSVQRSARAGSRCSSNTASCPPPPDLNRSISPCSLVPANVRSGIPIPFTRRLSH